MVPAEPHLQSRNDELEPAQQAPALPPVPVAVFEGCRRGDAQAMGEVYQRFAHVVHGIVLAAIGRADAEDVTQDVFMKVYRSIDSVRDSAALPGWICTVARNAALDHGRRRGRRLGAAPIHLVAEPLVEVSADEGDLAEAVLERIRTLPESYRETLVLRLVEGFTGPEIAARTGMTHGSVRVNLSRGMALLRPLLEKEGWS